MIAKNITVALVALVLVAGCETTYDMNGYQQTRARPGVRPAVGAIGGGASGALLCSQVGKGNGQVAMAALCGIGGALAGLGIGMGMDRSDSQPPTPQHDAMFRSPRGSQYNYQDPQTGNNGSLLMLGTDTQGGQYCREFQHKGWINGKLERMHGKACQQADGSWRIVG